VLNHDGRYAATCLTVLTFGRNSHISELTVFVLPVHSLTYPFWCGANAAEP
jgi:hypothetical protein